MPDFGATASEVVLHAGSDGILHDRSFRSARVQPPNDRQHRSAPRRNFGWSSPAYVRAGRTATTGGRPRACGTPPPPRPRQHLRRSERGGPHPVRRATIEHDQGDVEIVVYNRAILVRTDSEAVRRLHRVCCRLDDIATQQRRA